MSAAKSTPMNYSAIPSTESIDTASGEKDQNSQRRRTVSVIVIGFAVIAALLIIRGVALTGNSHSTSSSLKVFEAASSKLPMPHGVNLGSWLSLEDYFYVGDHGAVEVATPNEWTVGQCLPPLHTGQGPKWNSETDLFMNLTELTSVKEAIRTFHAFRISYLDFEQELPQMAMLGIRKVRVPVSWCLTDHDPSNDKLLLDDGPDDNDEELLERYSCRDPYFEQEENVTVLWPAVPRPLIANFLRACARHGIQAIIDVHTYPGGTSLGTFSGVWPRKPLFWKYDMPEDPDNDVGRQLFLDLLAWLEIMSEKDPNAFAGLGGITPMNEPAHLAGLFGPGSGLPDVKSYVPDLPKGMAKQYLSELREVTPSNLVSVSDGPHLRVLLWQRDAVEAFRATSLPSKGIQILVNLHESVFVPSSVPNGANPGDRHPELALIAAWWRGTTTAAERRTNYVIDCHHYHAWDKDCQGAVDGSGSYECGDLEATDAVLEQSKCAAWAMHYRQEFSEQLQDPHGNTILASGEFSASTHHSVLRSCMDVTTLRQTYLAQVETAKQAGVDLFWWSWKMPHGDAFRPAWSFKHFLYLNGFLSQPDESVISCSA